jgi:hypothetical protein
MFFPHDLDFFFIKIVFDIVIAITFQSVSFVNALK